MAYSAGWLRLPDNCLSLARTRQAISDQPPGRRGGGGAGQSPGANQPFSPNAYLLRFKELSCPGVILKATRNRQEEIPSQNRRFP